MGNSIHESDYDFYIEPLKKQMIRSIWRIVRNVADAEEILQDAFEKIWKQMKKIKKHPNPRPLILRICICSSYDFLRKKIRERQRLKSSDTLERAVISDTSQDDLVSSEIELEIGKAIIQLPRKQAEAVMMHFVQDQSYEEIAQSMECSETTVRTHVERGRKKLRKILAHLEPKPIS